MPDEYISTREFDGFTKAMRGDVQQLSENMSHATSKLDTLLNGRIEEARVMGEITEAIRAIRQELEEQKGEARLLRREIDGIRNERHNATKDSLKWWWELILFVLAGIIGGSISRRL